MKRQNPLQYYRTGSNDRQPFLRELDAIKSWTIAESILINVLLAVEELQDAQTPLDGPRADSFFLTRKRRSERNKKLFLYETFLRTTIGEIPCVVFSWDGRSAIALWPGYRSKLEETNKLSNYPYVNESVERLAEENSLTLSELVWHTS